MILILWACSSNSYEREKTYLIVGEYVLDTLRTKLPQDVTKEENYSNLRLKFNDDYTFELSKAVPFIADSAGTWTVGGMDEWCKLNYNLVGKNGTVISDQFGMPYLQNSDTIIYINSATPNPKYNISGLGKIYFKKIAKKI